MILAIPVIGVAVHGWFARSSVERASVPLVLQSSGTPIPAKPAEPNRGLPVRLVVPDLKIDAPITYMGVTASGSMAVPSNITDVGWYKHGALPGSTGSAVISGHINGPRGQPGVFAELSRLQAGSILTIIDANGLSTNFTVQTSKKYDRDAQPDEVFHSKDGAHLNLITCSGDWDKAQHRFAERLVVFADRQ